MVGGGKGLGEERLTIRNQGYIVAQRTSHNQYLEMIARLR
jgi:hypothetical protein